MTARIGSLFSGYGGLDLATEQVTGGEVVWHSEIDPNAAAVHGAHWPGIPNLGDITAINWTQVAPVDVICGGFPCTDLSFAGNGAGLEGVNSGLWYRMLDAVRGLRPGLVVIENVRALLVRGWGDVVGGLAGVGYDVRWVCVCASDVGAPHRRSRLFAVAYPHGTGFGWIEGSPVGRHPVQADLRVDVDERRAGDHGPSEVAWGRYADAVRRWERVTCRPAPDPVADAKVNPRMAEWMMGLPDGWVTGHGLSRTAELRMLGNGVVPQQAVAALLGLLEPAAVTT